MAELTNIIIHCSDSNWGSAAEIRRWHLARGWQDIGYHFIIGNGFPRPAFQVSSFDGAVEVGRTLDGDDQIIGPENGAHSLGYNDRSVGICLIGTESFTAKQFGALIVLVTDLAKKFGIASGAILGHRETELSGGKTCPNFDVEYIRQLVDKAR